MFLIGNNKYMECAASDHCSVGLVCEGWKCSTSPTKPISTHPITSPTTNSTEQQPGRNFSTSVHHHKRCKNNLTSKIKTIR